jgi:hypothetical protein
MSTPFPLLAACPHDIQLVDERVEGFVGRVPAAKGFIDAGRQALLAERHGILVIAPPRRRMSTRHRLSLLKAWGSPP